jgi:hypothetical protein
MKVIFNIKKDEEYLPILTFDSSTNYDMTYILGKSFFLYNYDRYRPITRGDLDGCINELSDLIDRHDRQLTRLLMDKQELINSSRPAEDLVQAFSHLNPDINTLEREIGLYREVETLFKYFSNIMLSGVAGGYDGEVDYLWYVCK